MKFSRAGRVASVPAFWLPVVLGLPAVTLLHAGVSTTPPAAAKAWWDEVMVLSGDAMEGRDTGSPGYDRAAEYVAGKFRQYGLQPAGEGGTYFQPITFEQVELDVAASSAVVVDANGHAEPLGSGIMS